MKICKEDGCKNVLLARGWCTKHYLRWYRYGSPYIVKHPKDFVPKGKDSPNYKHGKWQHPLYKTWSHMLARCENKNDKAYKYYGGRGITVCDRWHDINLFIADMGERGKELSIQRIDNSKGYFPDNCMWATSADQGRNRRIVKLSLELAEQIRKEPYRRRNGRGAGFTREEVAIKYGVSLATIKKVLSGSYWKPEAKTMKC